MCSKPIEYPFAYRYFCLGCSADFRGYPHNKRCPNRCGGATKVHYTESWHQHELDYRLNYMFSFSDDSFEKIRPLIDVVQKEAPETLTVLLKAFSLRKFSLMQLSLAQKYDTLIRQIAEHYPSYKSVLNDRISKDPPFDPYHDIEFTEQEKEEATKIIDSVQSDIIEFDKFGESNVKSIPNATIAKLVYKLTTEKKFSCSKFALYQPDFFAVEVLKKINEEKFSIYAFATGNEIVASGALKLIHNQKVLRYAATHCHSSLIIGAAAKNLKVQSVLGEIVEKSKDPDLRYDVIYLVKDVEILERLSKNKLTSDAAKRRLSYLLQDFERLVIPVFANHKPRTLLQRLFQVKKPIETDIEHSTTVSKKTDGFPIQNSDFSSQGLRNHWTQNSNIFATFTLSTIH